MSSTDSNASRGQVFQNALGLGPRPKPPAAPAEQFETRRQEYISAAAEAGGVQRTGSDADLLGFIGSRARRAGAARRILGD